MHPVVVDKQLNLYDCGVCTCLAIYCLVHGLDYLTMPKICLPINHASLCTTLLWDTSLIKMNHTIHRSIKCYVHLPL
jgi:hypothetical protein